MKLINTEGLALIGPGSEWFWAMAQLIVVVVTLGGIYLQLRGQGAANALHRIELLQGQYQSERMEYTKLALALDLKYEELGNGTIAKAQPLLDFFADLETLYVERHITLKEIGANWGRPIQVWFALLTPVVARMRETEGVSDLYDIGKFVAELRAFEVRRGVQPLQLNGSTLPELLDFMIDRHTASMRLNHEWKSGVIPGAPPTVTDAEPRPDARPVRRR